MVDIPKNIQQQKVVPDFDAPVALKCYCPEPKLDPAAVPQIKKMIAASRRPCIYAGGGIISAEAAGELVRFAEGYHIPVVTTLMGIGAIPDDHPLSLRWLGMHGTVYANYAANECDLLIALGARFDDRVTGNPKSFAVGAKIIHVDIDDSEINKNKPADLGVVANVKEVLAALNESPEPRSMRNGLPALPNGSASIRCITGRNPIIFSRNMSSRRCRSLRTAKR